MTCTENFITLGQTANVYNIEIEQGASWSKTLYLKKSNGFPKDLTGYTAKAQIRKSAESEDVITEIDVQFIPPRSNGVMVLSISAEDTKAFTFFSAVWDLFVESPDNKISKLLKGSVTNNTSVTRDEPVPGP